LSCIGDAERTLDVQYYMWDSDAVGYLLLSRLIEAADRGVSVRLLVDDLKFRSRTRSIASLCLQPNMEIRVFNPFRRRSNAVTQGLEFVRRFARLDQRMHNKLLVADNERAIFGGRNVAAEHFGLHEAFNFIDFDVELAGPDVADLSDVFESYWENPISVAGAGLDESVSEADLESTQAFIAEQLEARKLILTTALDEEEAWPGRALSKTRSLRPGAITVASDQPGVSQGSRPIQVHQALHKAVDSAKHDVVVATPFFVPSEIHVEWYKQMVDRGVRIRILTNSLASNPGTISNSGLNKQRMPVVKAGVELHELRTDAAIKPEWEIPPVVGRYLALHAKLYIIDREKLFLGSVNLDPRSKFINTEIGVLIDDEGLAQDASDAIVPLLAPENSWRVDIGPDGALRWQSDTESLNQQPARGVGQRAVDWIFGRLPIGDYI
jgi:putative cardiolipin synthase